ncbi:MAG: Gldg family protein [Planctomycetota bacterium]|nr:Gldg family protein [Planctomycetota bacterium]
MIGSQVLVSGLLALLAVLLLNHLSGRPGVVIRKDMTAKEVNSLDVSTQNVLKNLQSDVTVDVFFRGEQRPMTEIVGEVQARTQRLLARMEGIARDRFRIHQNDLRDVAAITQRTAMLRLRGLENCVVVHSEGKVEVVRLFGGLAKFDVGNPSRENYRPPSVRSFDGEIAILKAILSVTRGARPKLVFTTGHGELDPYGDGPESLGALETLLRTDGFIIDTWNPREEPDWPEGTMIMAVVGPTDDMGEAARSRIQRFVDDGGRLMVAPAADPNQLRSSKLAEWVQDFGLEITEGTVMEPFPDPLGTGALLTGERSVFFPIRIADMTRHEIVEPFMDTDRSFVASRAHGVRVVSQPEKGTGHSMPLFSSAGSVSWLDTVPLNYAHDAEIESIRSYDLAVVSEYSDLTQESSDFGAERNRSRILLLGSSDFLVTALLETTGGQGSSRDLALNMFNWLASREWRVNISPRDPDLRLLSIDKVPTLNRVVLWGIPGTFLILGLLVAFLRSRGGPQRV